jgi:2-polyprenyl-3-methyl-5-hydroxy-6-metoxy-1,4-benzoquinol methylase
MTPLLPKHYSRVLEIGCGEGNFRGQLNQECEYWGVEPFEASAKVASKKLDKVLIGTYQYVLKQLPKDYFDLVICNDVIEHMIDHDEFLQSITKNLKKEAYLVGSIPNVRYISNLFEILIKKDWRYKNAGIIDKTHLRFFTEKSLKRTIKENGFVIEQFQGINPYLAGSISIKGLLRRCLYCFAILIFGQDVKFLQFGIRIRYAEPSNKSPQPTV